MANWTKVFLYFEFAQTNENGRQNRRPSLWNQMERFQLIDRQRCGCRLRVSGSIEDGHHKRVEAAVLIVTLFCCRQTKRERIRSVRLNGDRSTRLCDAIFVDHVETRAADSAKRVCRITGDRNGHRLRFLRSG